MRNASFRDDVLWAIAYRRGLDPGVDFLKDQARAYASYINAWVRRLWDTSDWPEWALIHRFVPDPASHIIRYEAAPDDVQPEFYEQVKIGKILKVYLTDPRLVGGWGPFDTPFRMFERGYHVGYDHGPRVWIKYLTRAPKFSSDEWDEDKSYSKGNVVYVSRRGECFISLANGNRGHDPLEVSEGNTNVVMTTEITQEFAPANPGLPDTTQVMDILAAPAPGLTPDLVPPTLPDPPIAGQTFTIEVTDAAGTSLAIASSFGNAVLTLDEVFTDLASQLATALVGFTVTKMTGPLRIEIENLSGFKIKSATYTQGVAVLPLAVQQSQSYSPATGPTDSVAKHILLSISESQVLPGETYTLTFISLDGKRHPVFYTSLPTDGAEQIMTGLAAAVVALQGADTFFAQIQTIVDTVSPSLTFVVEPTIGKVSLDAIVQPPTVQDEAPTSIWWDHVAFPLALVDQVVRGAVADALREEGQADKGGAEEQAVATEQQVAHTHIASKQFDGLTDQQIPRSRYGR